MPIQIREIVSEITIAPPDQPGPPGSAAGTLDPHIEERIVRRAVARVLEQLRSEWDL